MFEVGDRVVCANDFDAPRLSQGEEYTIEWVDFNKCFCQVKELRLDFFTTKRFKLIENIKEPKFISDPNYENLFE